MIEPLAKTDDQQALIKHWWTIRQSAIELGNMAERNLLDLGILRDDERRFYTRQEWRRMTNGHGQLTQDT